MVNQVKSNDAQKEKYTEFLDLLYQEVLLRPPDKEGLEYFLSELTNKRMTLRDVIRMILDSEESRNIESFSHYSVQFWNNLDEVKQYLNRLSTDNEKTSWMEDIKKRFKEYIPFDKILVVGCGNGWVERQLYDLGIARHFDAFDISEEYLKTAIQEKGSRSINYFKADINDMRDVENTKYDAIINMAILHHAEKIERAMKRLTEILKPNGLMFNWEYVGPSRNQYTDKHLNIMQNIMEQLPERFRSKYPLRPHIENFRVEPTEAIHSDLIRELFAKHFDIIYERELNGGIAYQILWNNIEAYRNTNDKEAPLALKMLLTQDEKLSKEKKIPILFWYAVGKPKTSLRSKS